MLTSSALTSITDNLFTVSYFQSLANSRLIFSSSVLGNALRFAGVCCTESKVCHNFMDDANIYEYELQYGRKIVGEPGPVEFNNTLTFVCPEGTVAYMRNELSHQCRL